jgi:hypothetical protein
VTTGCLMSPSPPARKEFCRRHKLSKNPGDPSHAALLRLQILALNLI